MKGSLDTQENSQICKAESKTSKSTDKIGSKENIQKFITHYIHKLRKISRSFQRQQPEIIK